MEESAVREALKREVLKKETLHKVILKREILEMPPRRPPKKSLWRGRCHCRGP